MPKPILVGFDPGRPDNAPLEFGIAASRFTGAPLIVAGVHASSSAFGTAGEGLVEEQLEQEGHGKSVDDLARELREKGIKAECRMLPGTSAARALHEAAEQFRVGLVVVGSTERGKVGRLLAGSTAERLMHGAPCPVAVIPRSWEPGGGLHMIGVAYVDTPEGHQALEGAVALARRAGAKLRVLSAAKARGMHEMHGGGDAVTQPLTYEDLGSAIRVAAERGVAAATAGATGVEIESDVSVGDPADFLIAASERLDLLICGSRGYGPARAVLLGGVSRRVTSEAQCPVIVLPRGVSSGLEDLVDEQAAAST
jgi:nucleotide-binding universal stress UspA family protein